MAMAFDDGVESIALALTLQLMRMHPVRRHRAPSDTIAPRKGAVRFHTKPPTRRITASDASPTPLRGTKFYGDFHAEIATQTRRNSLHARWLPTSAVSAGPTCPSDQRAVTDGC